MSNGGLLQKALEQQESQANSDGADLLDKIAMREGIQGEIPSYSFINLSADYRINSKYRLFLTGKNIQDKIYIGSRLHSNPGQPQANISSGILPGPRRQINLGLEYNF